MAEVVCADHNENLHLQEVRSELLTAILHHDDGWAAWEASPALDPDPCRPYSFTELPRRESLPLWRDSILRARQIGALAGWVVAGHFERLLEDSDDADRRISDQWLAEVREWRSAWLGQWRSINRPVHTEPLANTCLEWLRLFDWFSLWLCCYCPARAEETCCEAMTLPDAAAQAAPIEVSPSTTQSVDEPREVVVTPWPFRSEWLELDVLGYAVPARSYSTPGELAKSRSPLRLRWRMVASG